MKALKKISLNGITNVIREIWGQTVDGGLHYPSTTLPTKVGKNSLLISEAQGLSVSNRDFVLAGGNNVNLKVNAVAGSTEFRVTNSQTNRFYVYAGIGGRLAVNEQSAKDKTVDITSIKFANGDDVTPYYGEDENDNDIIITTSEPLSEDTTLSTIRIYGSWIGSDIVSVGQGNKAKVGKVLQVGQALVSEMQQVAQIGIRQINKAKNSLMVGADNINNNDYCGIIGNGHETTRVGQTLLGLWTKKDPNTLLAVGNGTSDSNRSNAFAVTKDGDLILKGKDGKDYKLYIDNTGSFQVEEIV